MKNEIYILNELSYISQELGGKLISEDLINIEDKILFQCKNNHEFISFYRYIKLGCWCPFCINRKRTIEDLQVLAEQFGGKCLSPVFTGMNKKYLWECQLGHQWTAIPQNIRTLGRWCPNCGRSKSDKNRRKYTIQDMQELAFLKGGLCLSTDFESVVKKLLWQCEKGHQWEATPHHIRQGQWCPTCAIRTRGESRKTHTIQEMNDFALSKKGRCISILFENVKEKLTWECEKGHQWEANADNIINGSKWCPICAGNQKKNLQDIQLLAEKRGGKCLSTEYKGVNEKLLWECSEGHQWQTIPSVIIRGGWCPECSSGLGERICRTFFEQLFGHPFIKARPQWLRTQEDHQMELDGYCDVLKIAFEHQGLQHYQSIKYFDPSATKLKKIQDRDLLKVSLCERQGITLIQVPSVLDFLGIDNVKDFIHNECLQKGIILPEKFDQIEIDLYGVYCPQKLADLQKIAEKQGGKLISKKYLGIFEHLEWECQKGHRFYAAPNNVKNSGSWCPYCIGRYKTIKDMEIIAKQRNGKCLSVAYINNMTPLLWECKEGHQWQARPGNVLSGNWCPECAKKERGLKRRTHTIAEMREIAISHQGKCLSDEYQGTKKKLLWECKKKHQWEAKPESILMGNTWCPECKKAARQTRKIDK